MTPTSKAKETFLYLLAFVSLAFVATSVGGAYSAFIDAKIADSLNPFSRFGYESLRWQLAAIVVAAPVFFFAMRAIRRATGRDASLVRSGIRKWVTYIALFIAAAVILGGFIGILAKFFGGELTPRFIWKSVTVLAIAGLIFGYYFLEMRQDDTRAA